MPVINTNSTAMYANMHLSRANEAVKESMQKMASGNRIMSAKDDAAGLMIASQLNAIERGLGVAIRNGQDALSIAQVAEGAMIEQTQMLLRMRDLALQAANGSNGEEQRLALDAELKQLQVELTRIADTTTFGTEKLLNGMFQNKAFQVGPFSSELLNMDIPNVSASKLGQKYHRVHSNPVLIQASDNRSEIDGLNNIRQLDVNIDNKTYSIDLNYAMSEQELQDKINSIQGVTGVDVSLIQGTGPSRVQSLSKSPTETYATLLLSLSNFTAATAAETGQLNVKLSNGFENEFNFSVNIDSTTTQDSLTKALADLIYKYSSENFNAWVDEPAQGIGINSFLGTPKIDFEYTKTSPTAATDSLSFDLFNYDDDTQSLSINSSTSQAKTNGAITFAQGTPETNRHLLSAQSHRMTEVALKVNTPSTAGQDDDASGYRLALQFFVLDSNNETVAMKTINLDSLDGSLPGIRNFYASAYRFRDYILKQGYETEFDHWIEAGYIDNVMIENAGNNSPGFRFEQGKASVEKGYRISFQAKMTQAKGGTELDGLDITVSERQFSNDTYIPQDRLKVLSNITWDSSSSLLNENFVPKNQVFKSLSDYGERNERIRATSLLNGTPDSFKSFYTIHFTDGEDNILHSHQMPTEFVNDTTLFNTLMGEIYNSLINDKASTDFMEDYGIRMLFSPRFNGLDLSYEAKDSSRPTIINLTIEAKLSEDITSSNAVHTFGLQDAGTNHTLDFRNALKDEIRSVDIPLRLRDTRQVITSLDRSNSHFIVDFSQVSIAENIKMMTLSQTESNLNQSLALSDEVYFRSASAIHIQDLEGTQHAIEVIDDSLSIISKARANLGAMQNRVIHTSNNNSNIRIQVSEAKSRIMDLDFAKESTQLAKVQVLQQTSASMLTQANQISQIVLQLLQ